MRARIGNWRASHLHHGRWMLHISNAREQRIRPLKEIIVEYLVGYRLRNRGAGGLRTTHLGTSSGIVGNKLTVDIDAAAVLNYQEDRVREGASGKSVNEEVRFRLNMLGDPGEIVRAQLAQGEAAQATVKTTIGKAFLCERWLMEEEAFCQFMLK